MVNATLCSKAKLAFFFVSLGFFKFQDQTSKCFKKLDCKTLEICQQFCKTHGLACQVLKIQDLDIQDLACQILKI